MAGMEEPEPDLAEQRCTNCGSTQLRQDTNGVWHCEFCRSTFRADDPAMIVVDSPNVQQANENVIDTADMLTYEQQEQVSQHLRRLRDRSDVVVVVETVNTITQNVEHYARNRAQELGVGDDVKDNGVYILMVRQPRRVQVQAGDGVSLHLSSADINRVVQESFIPRFKADDYVGGLTDGADAIVATYEANRGSGRTFSGGASGSGSGSGARGVSGLSGSSGARPRRGSVIGWVILAVAIGWIFLSLLNGQGLSGSGGSSTGGDSGISWDFGGGGGSDWGGGGSDFGGGDFGGGSGGGGDW